MRDKRRPAKGASRSASARGGGGGRGGSRKPAGKRSKSGSGGRRLGLPAWLKARPEQLEQRHLDLIGLCLVGFSLYLGLVLYLGWEGGVVGGAASDGLTFLLGRVAYAVPFLAAAAAAALMLRPLLPALLPLRSGSTCILAGVLLALAAGTFGTGAPAEPDFDAASVRERGGIAGEGLNWIASSLFQSAGAHITATVLILAGLLLLTGATVAALVSATRRAAGRARSGGGQVARSLGSARASRAPGSVAATSVLDDFPGDEDLDPAVSVRGDSPVVVGADAAGVFEAELFDLEAGVEAAREPDDPNGEADGANPGWGVVEVADPLERSDAHAHGEEGSGDAAPDEGPLGEEDPSTPDDSAEIATGELTPMGAPRGVTISDQVRYRLPPRRSLERGTAEKGSEQADHEPIARKLVETLGHFGVEAKVVGIVSGPHVSRYELQLAPGIKVKKVSELANDLAYALASTEIRILAPIPGKQAVGVEVPNTRRRVVRLGDIYEGRPSGGSPLVAWLGRGIDGKPVWTDLANMPHVLVAGTTGSGKSGCVNAILSSVLMHSDPNEARLLLVDPKQVELNHYEDIPHLLTPVVTSPRLAANVLSNLIGEMESRYAVMGQARCRNLVELNRTRAKAGEPPLPHILCVIDELADLMMVSPAEVEDSIIRLAQKSRATGIHLVLATQRPSTDIITGTIKVNIPARIAFAVSSQTDSRVILDQGGAESLLGQGDMLFRGAGTSKLERIQGAFVTEEEIASITDCWAGQGTPEYDEELLEAAPAEDNGGGDDDTDPDHDDLLEQAIRLVIDTETASVSLMQRRLRVGYTRAGRLIDMLERRGAISGFEGSKPRQVLVSHADVPRLLGQEPPAPTDETAAGEGAETDDREGEAETLPDGGAETEADPAGGETSGVPSSSQ